MPPPHRFFFNTIRFYVFFWHYPAWQCFVWEKLKKDPRVWCSPRCKDGQNCHCGRLSFHFPDIRSRWRLWRLKADHCALLSKRPIIILAIFRPHQWLINCVQFSFPQKISCFFFFIERLSWWMDSQFCLFAQGFLLPYIWWSVSCYKYSFGQIFEPDLCRSSARQRGWGLLARLVKISATQ